MKFRIASDFHLEFYSNYTNMIGNRKRDIHENTLLNVMDNENEQVLLLAGDMCTSKHIEYWYPIFDALSKRFKHICIIAGNHEHYGSIITESFSVLREFYSQWDNITFLEDEVFIIEDVAIFGATMWTNFNGSCPNAIEYTRQSMNDFRIIRKEDGTTYSPNDSMTDFHCTKFALQKFFIDHKDYKNIVMTHHSPSFQSTAEIYKGSLLNSAFASSLEDFILDNRPEVWVHGHMHNTSEYNIGDTKIICNPKGYYSENKAGYKTDLVIEI